MSNREKNSIHEEQKLHAERYRRLVEESLDIIYIFSNKRGGLYCSPRVREVLGYTTNAFLKDSFLWYNSIHPDDKESVDNAIAEFEKGRGYSIEYRIKDTSDNWHWFFDRFIGKTVQRDEIIIEGLATDITARKNTEIALKEKNIELEKMLLEIKTLRGLIPICSICKKIRNDEGYWQDIERFFVENTELEFSHGLCLQCSDELYGEEEWYKVGRKKKKRNG